MSKELAEETAKQNSEWRSYEGFPAGDDSWLLQGLPKRRRLRLWDRLVYIVRPSQAMRAEILDVLQYMNERRILRSQMTRKYKLHQLESSMPTSYLLQFLNKSAQSCTAPPENHTLNAEQVTSDE